MIQYDRFLRASRRDQKGFWQVLERIAQRSRIQDVLVEKAVHAVDREPDPLKMQCCERKGSVGCRPYVCIQCRARRQRPV